MHLPVVCPPCQNECHLTDAINTPSLSRVEGEWAAETTTEKEFEEQSQLLHRGEAKLEAEEARLEPNVEQKLNEGRLTLTDEVWKQLKENCLLREAEKDELINEIKQATADLKRKLELYSQQNQCKMTQIDLDWLLLCTLPVDLLVDVAKSSSLGNLVQI